MKKYLQLIFLIIVSCVGFACCKKKVEVNDLELLYKAKPALESDFEFTLTEDSKGVVLRKYKGSAEYLVLPETIQGMPVVDISIGEMVDKDKFDVSKNFLGYPTNVKGIAFPSKLERIGNFSFAFSSTITTIIFPSSLVIIGGNAFEGCSGLTNLSFPSSLCFIDRDAFKRCRNLLKVDFPPMSSLDYLSGFEECDSLVSIVLPENLRWIGVHAFKKCESLTSVKFPKSLQYIVHEAFNECSNLTSIDLPEGVNLIGREAFASTGLESVTIPKKLKIIGRDAFGRCDSLSEINLPNGISLIEMEGIDFDKNGEAYLWYDRFMPANDFNEFFSGKKIKESIALQKLLKENKTPRIEVDTDWLGNPKRRIIYNW
jgi:hypothetical protein